MADDESTTDEGHEEVTETDDPGAGDDTGIDNDGETNEAEDDWTPPSKEDFEKLQATLKSRNAKITNLRKQVTEAKRPPVKTVKKSTVPPGEAPPSDDSEDDRHDAAAEAAERLRVTAVRAGAVGVVLAAGFNGDRRAAKDIVKLMDLSGIEPDDDGDVDDDDLADAIDALKERFPRLFEAPEDRRPMRRPTTADKGGERKPPAQLDATARTSRKLLKQAGYR